MANLARRKPNFCDSLGKLSTSLSHINIIFNITIQSSDPKHAIWRRTVGQTHLSSLSVHQHKI